MHIKPTKTINKLHFEDLSFSRFEDLCLAIIYRLDRWEEIYHYGRSGKDDGIDIHAIQHLEDMPRKNWFIQCKRYKTISKSQLISIVDQAVNKNETIPDVLLTIVSCDVSKKNTEEYKKYANKKGISNPIIWTASVLETKLYTENHDLLFAYFGISLTSIKRNRIATVRRNIKLKQRMKKDFIKPYDPNQGIRRPPDKFRHSEVLIRSIDDVNYPENIKNEFGKYPWFKVEMYDFYHNGIEVIFNVREVIIDKEGYWDLVEYNNEERKNKYVNRTVFEVGCIPYENIIDYDIEGDEFCLYPHIYCDFKNNGMPYEDIRYYVIPQDSDESFFDYLLDNNKRKKLK